MIMITELPYMMLSLLMILCLLIGVSNIRLVMLGIILEILPFSKQLDLVGKAAFYYVCIINTMTQRLHKFVRLTIVIGS